jgi:DNA repair protein RadA/Sms
MAKARTQYVCSTCGGVQSRWMGKCPDCGAWDALQSFTPSKPKAAVSHAGAVAAWTADDGANVPAALATPLPEVDAPDVSRLGTGIRELDRVLGGGFVAGSAVLLGGDPGIGKSTLLLQAAGRLAGAGHRVLYVSSEESAHQTRLRAERLFGGLGEEDDSAPGLEELFVLAETDLSRIVEQARRVRPAVLVLDSVQLVYKADLEAAPGSVAQLRRCCTDLVYLAKVSNMAIAVVGHVTKDGQLAGPKLLEHLVDVVLSFEGDRHHAHRVVRGIKNRFGTTLEVGLFEMTGGGLLEVRDASALQDPAVRPQPGSVVCPVMHGSRCLLVEVQALTATGFLGSAKRRASGLDASRLAMLIAVLEQHGGVRLADQDVFASSAGGLRVTEPAADLALCLAIAGARLRRTIPAGTAVVGEVGLGGEIRPVHQVEQRIREATRLGFDRILIAAQQADGVTGGVGIATIGEAMALLEAAPPPAKARGGP